MSPMNTIDKQRIAAVVKLEELGYTYSSAHGWAEYGTTTASSGAVLSTEECDAMHAVLMRRADALQGCSGGSPEEVELEMIINAIEAYEAKRWPDGMEPGKR